MPLWKDVERRVAKDFCGVRLGPVGKTLCDVISSRFAIEVKERADYPNWLYEALGQAMIAGEKTRRIPLVVLHLKGGRYEDDMVVMRSGDFRQLFPEDKQLDYYAVMEEVVKIVEGKDV